MGFLAPLGGLIGGLFGGGTVAGLTGSQLGNLIGGGLGVGLGGFGGQSGQQRSATNTLQGLIQQLSGTANQYGPLAQQFYGTANQALPQALNFWSPLLGGSRTAATSVLAPDINRINEQYDSILQGTMGSRTGAGASIYAAAPYEKQAQIQSLFSGIRPQAAQQVANIGGTAGNLGNSVLNNVLGALAQALGGGQGLLRQANDAYTQSQSAGSIFGNLIGNILDELDNSGSSTVPTSGPGVTHF